LNVQFRGSHVENFFHFVAVGADPFLKVFAVDMPLQECLQISFYNTELSAENGHLLGLFRGCFYLIACRFVDGGIAFARSLRDNPNQGPRRIQIAGSLPFGPDGCGVLRTALVENKHLDAFEIGASMPRATDLSGIFAALKFSGSDGQKDCFCRARLSMMRCALTIVKCREAKSRKLKASHQDVGG